MWQPSTCKVPVFMPRCDLFNGNKRTLLKSQPVLFLHSAAPSLHWYKKSLPYAYHSAITASLKYTHWVRGVDCSKNSQQNTDQQLAEWILAVVEVEQPKIYNLGALAQISRYSLAALVVGGQYLIYLFKITWNKTICIMNFLLPFLSLYSDIFIY